MLIDFVDFANVINCSFYRNYLYQINKQLNRRIFKHRRMLYMLRIFQQQLSQKKNYNYNCFIAICFRYKIFRKINVCFYYYINCYFAILLILNIKFDFLLQTVERYNIRIWINERISNASSILTNNVFLRQLWTRNFDVIEIKSRIRDFYWYIRKYFKYNIEYVCIILKNFKSIAFIFR